MDVPNAQSSASATMPGTADMRTCTPLEVLRAARQRIADEEHWCVGAFATRGRRPVKPTSKAATRWCAVGAIHAEQGTDPFALAAEMAAVFALCDAAQSLYRLATTQVNDFKGHAAVLAVYDAAIAAAERDEPPVPGDADPERTGGAGMSGSIVPPGTGG